MSRKNYFGHSTPVAKSKTAEHAAILKRVADEMDSRYEEHAKKLRTMADHMIKSHGQPRLREARKPPDKKTAPID